MKHYILGLVVAIAIVAIGIYLSIVQPSGSLDKSVFPIVLLISSFLLSILSILIADRFESNRILKEFSDRMKKEVTQIIPAISTLRRFNSAEEAIAQIIQQLPRAETCWNTRMSPRTHTPGNDRSAMFENAVVSSIWRGLTYHDIVTKNHSDYVDRVISATQNAKGRYSSRLAEIDLPVINFIVIKYSAKDYDLYLGWPVSQHAGAERPVFLTTDARLALYFIEYHELISREIYTRHEAGRN